MSKHWHAASVLTQFFLFFFSLLCLWISPRLFCPFYRFIYITTYGSMYIMLSARHENANGIFGMLMMILMMCRLVSRNECALYHEQSVCLCVLLPLYLILHDSNYISSINIMKARFGRERLCTVHAIRIRNIEFSGFVGVEPVDLLSTLRYHNLILNMWRPTLWWNNTTYDTNSRNNNINTYHRGRRSIRVAVRNWDVVEKTAMCFDFTCEWKKEMFVFKLF